MTISVSALRLMLTFMISLVTLSVQATSVSWDESEGGDWKTRESDHFVIHFREDQSESADKSLNIAERVHNELVPFFGYEPEEKTQMVLVDDFDLSNGWATVIPYAQIRLFSSPPEDVNSLESNDDWLHLLIRHEYTHILQMDMGRGTPLAGRSILGRFYLLFPHVITPSFMIEGLAVYTETDHEKGYGRLQSSYYNMLMRTEVASGELKTLGEVSTPLREWPRGVNYLYGSYFYQYLSEVYGEDKIREYLVEYSGEIIPAVLQNSVADDVFGKDFDELWEDYETWLIARFDPKIKELENSSLAEGTQAIFQKNKPAQFLDVSASRGDYFVYQSNTGEDTPELILEHNGKRTTLPRLKDIQDIDVNAAGEIVATRLIAYASGKLWADIYRLDEEDRWVAVTHKKRFRKVRWANRSRAFIASRKEGGVSQLYRVSTEGEERLLWKGKDDSDVLGGFDVSPDGNFIVAAMKRGGEGWNLERKNLNCSSCDWQKITNTRAIENTPYIAEDGRVIFSADYNGVFNIYRMSSDSKSVQPLTNMLTGAFAPVQYGDDIMFQAYTDTGFEFRTTALQSAFASVPLNTFAGSYNYPAPYFKDVPKSETEDYSPWSSLSPRWWFPIWVSGEEYSQVGLQTGGNDALHRQFYSASFAVDTTYEIADAGLSYIYDNRYQLSFSRIHTYRDLAGGDELDAIEQSDNWVLSRLNLRNALDDQLSLNAAVVSERKSSVKHDDLTDLLCRDGRGQIRSACEKQLVGAGLFFDSREGYVNAPGFSNGRYLDLIYETNDVLDSDYEGGVIHGQWIEVFDLPGPQTLSFQVLAGTTGKDGEPFSVGGENRFTEQSLFGRDEYALRGYDSSVQEGRHVQVNRLNYTHSLARVESGWGIWPIGLGDISGSVFADYGSAWNDEADYLTSVGVALNTEIVLAYELVLPLQVVHARGLDEDLGERRTFISLSLPY